MNSKDDRELLEQTFEYAKENNRILKNLRRSARWNRFWRIVYWLAIVAAAVGLYYYLRPFLAPLLEVYENLDGLKGLNEVFKSGILPGAGR